MSEDEVDGFYTNIIMAFSLEMTSNKRIIGNYAYYLKDKLGDGTSSEVYVGTNLKTSTPFSSQTNMLPSKFYPKSIETTTKTIAWFKTSSNSCKSSQDRLTSCKFNTSHKQKIISIW